MSAVRALREAHPDAWTAATTGPFLDGVADGSVADGAFDRWLEQDYHFVTTLIRAWGLMLQTAPRRDYALLLGGMTAFEEELSWFESMAADRRLDLEADLLPASVAYDEALLRLAAEPYAVAITAMWAVEDAYLTSWEGVGGGAAEYTGYVAHWANEEFAAFVDQLGSVVDRELPDGPTAAADRAYREILDREADFWAMTVQ